MLEKQKPAEPVKPPKVRLPKCPFCKAVMTQTRYGGYYESFDYWDCQCRYLPSPKEWKGHFA